MAQRGASHDKLSETFREVFKERNSHTVSENARYTYLYIQRKFLKYMWDNYNFYCWVILG